MLEKLLLEVAQSLSHEILHFLDLMLEDIERVLLELDFAFQQLYLHLGFDHVHF